MSNQLPSPLLVSARRAGLPHSMLIVSLVMSGACTDGAERPTDGSTGMTTVATATTGRSSGSTSGGDSTPDPSDTQSSGGSVQSTSGSDSSPATSQGATDAPTDTSSDSGGNDQGCQPGTDDVTAMGEVVASSTFGDNEYPAALGADGDPATSWFSAGPGPEAGPATFAWALEEPRCLSTIVLTGNGGHANPDFHEQFGFEAVAVHVFLGEKPVFQMEDSLEGTPDPTLTVEFGNVLGDRIELELSDHEDPICGGFAELQVIGG
ncbi:MAG: hypothetical protein KUG77_05635 [Nannocystaceae bacterium]|nr:hypothetical protein [Nannocystaceae bacterium]